MALTHRFTSNLLLEEMEIYFKSYVIVRITLFPRTTKYYILFSICYKVLHERRISTLREGT